LRMYIRKTRTFVNLIRQCRIRTIKIMHFDARMTNLARGGEGTRILSQAIHRKHVPSLSLINSVHRSRYMYAYRRVLRNMPSNSTVSSFHRIRVVAYERFCSRLKVFRKYSAADHGRDVWIVPETVPTHSGSVVADRRAEVSWCGRPRHTQELIALF